jgi:diguanylate cyclase (GGDEF)-like protein
MTGLYNKREFWERLEKEMRRSERQRRPLSLMMIDLDRLKWFNDSFGHVQGDLMLVKIGELLQNNCRASDTAFRYGGDELCLLLADTSSEEARVMAERLRVGAREIRLDVVSENTVIGAEAMITMSIGIASFPLNALRVEQLFEMADAAMFRAKETGKDRVCVFDPEVDTNYRLQKDPDKPYRDTRLELPESVKAEMQAQHTNNYTPSEAMGENSLQTDSPGTKLGDFEVAGMEEVDIDE